METGLTLTCLRCGHSWLRRSLAKLPGTCPGCCSPYWNRSRKGEKPPNPPKLLPTLTRAQGLKVAADVIRSLRGYRKNPGYRTMQNDLNFVCEVLQRTSAGEPKISQGQESRSGIPQPAAPWGGAFVYYSG